MSDSPDDDLPVFTPVPVRARRDGWTPDRQRRFIRALAACGVVAAAARAVGKSATTAYALRERPGAESFASAWDIAVAMAGDQALETAIDRMVNGVEVPRFYRGVQVATVRRPDYRLALKVLDHHLAARGPAMSLPEALALLGDEPAPLNERDLRKLPQLPRSDAANLRQFPQLPRPGHSGTIRLRNRRCRCPAPRSGL